MIKIKRSIKDGALPHVVGKSGEKWEGEEKRWEVVANFLPPFGNTLEQFLLFFYTYMDHTRHSVSINILTRLTKASTACYHCNIKGHSVLNTVCHYKEETNDRRKRNTQRAQYAWILLC